MDPRGLSRRNETMSVPDPCDPTRSSGTRKHRESHPTGFFGPGSSIPDPPTTDTSHKDAYEFAPLPPRTIRLVHLMPHEDEHAEIQCQLVGYPLERFNGGSGLYEALSYVWGDPSNPRKIYIGGNILHVTTNLHAALRKLRDPLMTRVLWIDAICIDQRDDVEKGQQVEYMAEIYSKASQVIVWLGEPEDGCDQALEDICVSADEFTSSSPPTPQLKKQISSLISRPWFERIWVLQEVAAARHVVIKCGSTEVDGYAFCMALNSESLGILSGVSITVRGLVRSAIYLIQRAAFRPKSTQL